MPLEVPGSPALFSAADLNSLPGVSGVTDEQATMVERIVWGWLKPVLGLTDRPTPVPDEVFAWAVELGAIAYANPNGLSYYQLGEERSGFSAERRVEILGEAASGGQAASSAGRPRGCFPPAQAWPDPATTRYSPYGAQTS